ncbi:glycine-rich domain-containing protein [Falsirhodobacter deserti]|uniref:glycine-rich domain-containing protein n=1 Tax=Falsirhodobacter deserti TaxID=1365611 RepID=UPI000FE2E24C|nr:hypothetical protein [Falsirhodobacter deserti]
MLGLGISLGLAAPMLAGPAASKPVLTVTNGQITPFSRDGVHYVEVLWQQSGGFTLSRNVTWHNRALGAGGANGGRQSASDYVPGGGGAGGLLMALGAPFAAGDYTVEIGAGAPANNVNGGGSNGSDSRLITPSETLVAIGGGRGASAGVGNTLGQLGGSGGGGRGGAASQVNGAGEGTAGQGYAGSAGYRVDDLSRASGAGGGAGSAGGPASANTGGTGGAGRLLTWIATPREVCRGGDGMNASASGSSPNETWGNGAKGAISGIAGKGGDGFMFLVVRADEVQVKASA